MFINIKNPFTLSRKIIKNVNLYFELIVVLAIKSSSWFALQIHVKPLHLMLNNLLYIFHFIKNSHGIQNGLDGSFSPNNTIKLSILMLPLLLCWASPILCASTLIKFPSLMKYYKNSSVDSCDGSISITCNPSFMWWLPADHMIA